MGKARLVVVEIDRGLENMNNTHSFRGRTFGCYTVSFGLIGYI